MGNHKLWRRIAKRERRRRFRIQQAKEKDEAIDCNTAEYQEWVKEQVCIELFELEQIKIANIEENEKWLSAEKIAAKQWKTLQEQRELLRIQRLEEEIKLKMEWELEKEKKKREEEKLKEIEEQNKKRQETFMKHLEQFLSGDSVDPPEELLVSRETKPDSEPCPFFSKTACCRFGDQCSRNHRYPGISKVLLATNFFSHFGLENANDYDADIMLEYEESDTYKEFKEFFFDVLPEFEHFGRITQFKVCNNYEKHLRGNTYVEFFELRCAVAAYRALHTRWYGGKQLSLQFCVINSWKNAICGLQSRKKCPKGRSCNFMHVFRNPNNMFSFYFNETQHSERSRRSPPPRSWRWSESPEVELPRRRSRSSERKDRRREDRDRRELYRRSDRDRRESYRKKQRHRREDSRRSERDRRDNSWREEKDRHIETEQDKREKSEESRTEERIARDDSRRKEKDEQNEDEKEEKGWRENNKRNKDTERYSRTRRKNSDQRSHRGSS